MDLNELLGAQVRRPSGYLGWLLGHIMARGHRLLTEWTIGMLDVRCADRVLDLGCGSGMAVQALSQIAADGFVAGVDYSPTMVRQARRRNAAAVNAGRAAILHADVAALPWAGDTFDRLSAIETFYFWPRPVMCLQEARRVLKPGGQAAVSMEMSKEGRPSDHSAADTARAYAFTIYDAGEMVRLFRQAGFGKVQCVSDPDRGEGWLCTLGVA
jgi:ubiquinone/menaquinone biosynthesis C-methylase UbiE